MTLRDRVNTSLSTVRAARKRDWLELFAADAVIEDPVGQSSFDPAGLGHRGIHAIGRFWDEVIARNKAFDYIVTQSHVCGNEVASVAQFAIVTAAGLPWTLDLVIIHRFDSNQKMLHLRKCTDPSLLEMLRLIVALYLDFSEEFQKRKYFFLRQDSHVRRDD